MNSREREKQKIKRSSAKGFANTPPGRENTCVKLVPNTEFLKLTPGTLKIDFIPYIVKSDHNRRADKGTEHFEREYEAHRVPTAGGNNLYVCRANAFGKKCAVCDWLKSHGGTADPELVKDLRPKVRNLWLVNEEPGNAKAKLKILDQTYYNRGSGFGELMKDVIDTLDEDVEPFALKGGCTATLTVKEITFPGGKFNGVTRIDLRPRKHEYPVSMIENGPCLDDCLIDPGYDKVMKLLESGVSDEESDKPKPEDDEDRPTQNQKSAPEEEDDENDSEAEDSDLEEGSDTGSETDSDLEEEDSETEDSELEEDSDLDKDEDEDEDEE